MTNWFEPKLLVVRVVLLTDESLGTAELVALAAGPILYLLGTTLPLPDDRELLACRSWSSRLARAARRRAHVSGPHAPLVRVTHAA